MSLVKKLENFHVCIDIILKPTVKDNELFHSIAEFGFNKLSESFVAHNKSEITPKQLYEDIDDYLVMCRKLIVSSGVSTESNLHTNKNKLELEIRKMMS